MKLFTYLKLELFLLVAILLFDYLVFTHTANLFRELYTIFFLLIVPGLLIVRLLHIITKNVWEYGVIVVGLSIFFLMFGGLIENSLLPVFSLTKPLRQMPLFVFFNVLFGLLLLLNISLPKRTQYSFSFSRLSFLDALFVGISCLFPLLAVFGAISLNNGGSNLLTLLLLCIVPITFVFMVLLEKKVHEGVYYWYLLLTSISLLLMLSLRSWHIAGWDINDEFRIFQLTKTKEFWNPTFQHAYNACLSLTILPTILSIFTTINDEYLYKVVLQVVFGLSPLVIYSLYRNFTNKVISFLAVFYIISQPFFIQSMTGLIRQEVSFFFFALVLYAVFCRTIKKQKANLLFILFGMSMIVSHYSTAYTTIGLFLASYFIIAVTSIIEKHSLIKKLYNSIKNLKFDIHLSHGIQAVPLLVLLAFTYFWFFQYTQTSGNLTTVFRSVIASLPKPTSPKVIKPIKIEKKKTTKVTYIPSQSDETRKALEIFTGSDPNTYQNIHLYLAIRTDQYAGATIPKYPVRLQDEHFYPVNPISLPSKVPVRVSHILNDFLSVIKLITKIIIFLGPLLLVLKYIHKITLYPEDKEFIILTIVGVGLVVAIICIPALGRAYNLPRAYLQILFIAAYGGIIFIVHIIPKISKRIIYFFVSLILFSIFVLFSGLANQFIGGFAYMHLNNFGEDYDKFYTHDQEVYAATWFGKYANQHDFVYADEVSGLRLLSFANFNNTLSYVVPSAMYTHSYVYARYANVTRLRTDATLGGMHLDYSYPIQFLDEHKNLIYTNGGSRIYR